MAATSQRLAIRRKTSTSVDEEEEAEPDFALRRDADRYKLYTYFSSPKDKYRKFANPRMYDEKVEVEEVSMKGIVYALLALPCESIHILGGKYYSRVNFAFSADLYNTFIELPRKTACLFLAEEVARDKDFWEKIEDGRSFGTSKKIRAILIGLVDVQKQEVQASKAKESRVCRKNTLQNANICPRGYAFGKESSVLTRAADSAGVDLCCVEQAGYVGHTPVVWNDKIETKVLHSIREALLDTIKLNLRRKVFESSHDALESSKDCNDKEILKPKAAVGVLGEHIATAGRKAEKALKKTFQKMPDMTLYADNFKAFLVSFPAVKRTVAWATHIGEVVKDFLAQFYEQFIQSKYAAVLLRNIKKRLLEAVCEYIISTDILKHFTPKLPPAAETNTNYQKLFAKRLVEAHRQRPGKTHDIAQQLWRIFASKLKEDENMYNEIFTESLGKMLALLGEVSLGFSDVFLNTADRVSNEVITSAFEKVFVSFFFIKFRQADILEYILTVFDVSGELLEDTLTATRYKFLSAWRRKINSQIFGAEHLKEETRVLEQNTVLEKLWKTNFFISEIEDASNTRGSFQIPKIPDTFREFEEIIRISEIRPHVSEVRKQLFLEDAPPGSLPARKK